MLTFNRTNKRHPGRQLFIICLFAVAGLISPRSLLAYDLKMDLDGETRVARVFESNDRSGKPLPLVLAFHGYGDNRTNFARFVDLHLEWPEAIVVYPEGLRMPDREGKLRARGWQTRKNQLENRDLRYIDALVKELGQRYSIDRQRIYATGFSNGGWLVFLLMGQRSDMFAAYAPVGAVAAQAVLQDVKGPRPIIYIIGKEEIAGNVGAATATVQAISGWNLISGEQSAWADGFILYHPAEGGEKFVFNLHKGGHIWPYLASREIVRFFRQQKSQDCVSACP